MRESGGLDRPGAAKGLLNLENAWAGYGNRKVVRGVSLTIERGEFCALLGLNGSGKTTLLKALCGLLPMEEGRCLVDSLDCTGFNEYKRARYISYIPQRYSKMQGVTVLDAVLMGRNPHLALFASPTVADRQQAKNLLDKMGIPQLAHEDFARISEGQKQLVILARTLLQDAPVMLMDEPDSALDFLNRHKMLSRVRQLIQDEGKAGLVTLHDPNFALAYCHRIFLLQEGQIIGQLSLAEAPKEEIWRCLTKIYGDIVMLEHEGKYMMLQA